MEVISTNIGSPQVIIWRGKEVQTGIFKFPVGQPVYLGRENVGGDHVIDRKYHGGIDKACYLFSKIHYSYWEKLYPALNWQWGMFGENLTISGLDEKEVKIGDTFKIGKAVVQATQPRQPCFKLGVRFKTQDTVRQFIEYGYSGVYVRVLEPGAVKPGDTMELVESRPGSFSVYEIFRMIYDRNIKPETVQKAISNPHLAESCRRNLKKRRASK